MSDRLDNREPKVRRWQTSPRSAVAGLLGEFGIKLIEVAPGRPIPGSFWGDDEAGLIRNGLYVRPDTPLHSVLHEACHWICMDEDRRAALDTNAGGDYDEENAVCYLQIVLAGRIDGYSVDECLHDMDAWGYSFRLGSARAWFERDAEDARSALLARGIQPETGRLLASTSS